MVLRHAVPREFLTEIGDIVVSYSILESALQTVMVAVMGDASFNASRQLNAVLVELSFSQLLAATKSVALVKVEQEKIQQEWFERLECALKSANTIDQKRNSIVHCMWASGSGPDIVMKAKSSAKLKRGLRFQADDVTVEILSKFAAEIGETSGIFLHLAQELIE